MNILFFTTNKNYTEKIVNFLSINNNISCFLTYEKEECENQFIKTKEKALDLVINFSDSLFDKLYTLCEKYQVPLFQITQNIFFINEKDRHTNFMTHFIFIYDEIDLIPSILLNKSNMYLLPMIFSQRKYSPNKKRDDSQITNILIFIDCQNIKFSPIYELISFLNFAPNCLIHIIDNKLQDNLLNTNIKVSRMNDTENIMSEIDVVIGNKEIIYQGILMKKFCIVVGEKGYGGIVNPETFQKQYESGFQGRIGGNFAEKVPSSLLDNDLSFFLSLSKEEKDNLFQKNIEILEKNQHKVFSFFQNFLRNKLKECNQYKNNFINVSLKFSNEFSLEIISDKKFVLRNNFSGKLHSYVELEEASIINCFNEKNTVKNVMKTSGYGEEEKMFVEFIRTLCDEKILIFV